jgi:hypothetical protein
MATSFGDGNIKKQAPNNQNNNNKDQIRRMLMMSPTTFEGENK